MPTSDVEIVITAPEMYGAKLAYRTGARMTLGVLTQLVAQARQSLVVAACERPESRRKPLCGSTAS